MSQGSNERWVGRRVLVVDDEPTARRSLAWLFTDSGLSVTVAASGEEALQAMAAERFDLMLTDIRMPGIDGVDLLRRALILDPELTVVLMTAYGEVQNAVRAMSEGAFWYVTKPVNVEVLMDVMRRAFELRGLREELADAPPAVIHGRPGSLGATLAAVERDAIVGAVRVANGDLAEAARALGVSVPFLVSRVRRYEGAT